MSAVVGALPHEPAIVDAQSLRETEFYFSPPVVNIRRPEWELHLEHGTRAWIRRLSPMSWEAGTVIGSHEAVDKASWLALLSTVLRNPNIEWLTHVDAMIAAENKLTQYTIASRQEISVPWTVVSNEPARFDSLQTRLIAKPLGPGHFQDPDGRWLTVFTDSFNPNDREDIELLTGPPFIVQQMLQPKAHLRIVTVRDEAWVFRLSAEGLPLDWRELDRGHRDWECVRDIGVADSAIDLARAHELGYSSQDWIETRESLFFIDLNPSGQWLFLPSPWADDITASIASWLASSCR